ncbi:MAG: CAP domain-containing protein [Burkholderiaceae bacterium]
MTHLLRLSPFVPTLLLSLALAACGGSDSSTQTAALCGGDSSAKLAPTLSAATISQQLAQETDAPQVSGNMATDGLNWFNFRRQKMGLASVDDTNLQIKNAAQQHSEYQKINNIITHEQTSGKDGFTGVDLQARLSKANYNLVPNYAIGEVIAKTGYTYGFTAAEALITAIYHRFVIFEPMYKEAGAGYATAVSGYTYFTTDFASSNGFGPGLTSGKVALYPYDTQQQVPTSFDHSSEEPDPFPEVQCRGIIVGYPISVHVNLASTIGVTSFTLSQTVSSQDVPVRQLNKNTDPGTFDEPRTPAYAAAIIPLAPLLPATSYTVQFVGSVDGQSANRTWSFKTK